ncbi:hypothetical protein FIBSPDRAFT_874534 [Athelia psychrophila]|uniref:Uncharacterized protein n=1 Tax=Athelia psychrophila TaxID=1759441 RepID=A0A165XFM9_9AGAM|nr:hypothetical protein FIBSPDRAFT_874534 [Fibularhizoctonia sp. CBS 109695]
MTGLRSLLRPFSTLVRTPARCIVAGCSGPSRGSLVPLDVPSLLSSRLYPRRAAVQ